MVTFEIYLKISKVNNHLEIIKKLKKSLSS